MPPLARRLAWVALLALPWLWPFTSGPTASIQPYLVSVAAAGLLLALWPPRASIPQMAGWIATGLLLAALVSSVLALLQYFHLDASLRPWVVAARGVRAYANLRQPNQLATLLVIGLAALHYQLGVRRVAVVPAAMMAILLAVALAATASRTGLVELLALGGAVAWWGWRAGRGRAAALAVAGVMLVYVAATVGLPWLLHAAEGTTVISLPERLQGERNICESRLTLWRNVLHLIALRSWTGWGWGELDWAHYITLYDGPRFCNILDNAHNLPLHIAVELGVPIALSACIVAGWAVAVGRPWAEARPERQLAWGVLLAIGVHSMLEYPLWYGTFQIAALLAIWLLVAPRHEGSGRHTGALLALRLGVAAALLLVAGYAGWDYRRISQLYLPAQARAPEYRDDALAAALRSRLYANAVRFALVTTTRPTPENAAGLLNASLRTLHYSPEPSVITRVIESAALLGKDELARTHAERFRIAFPARYRAWARAHPGVLQQLGLPAEPASAPASDNQNPR